MVSNALSTFFKSAKMIEIIAEGLHHFETQCESQRKQHVSAITDMKICKNDEYQLDKPIQQLEPITYMNLKVISFISREKNKQVSYADMAKSNPQ
jgi:hypothetical protein